MEMFQCSGNLGDPVRPLEHPWPDNLFLKKPRLHIKLYYFSHPEPHVLVGTFNPSGNQPEDPRMVVEIGDQDRGHNYLVEITDSRIVRPLREHAVFLHTAAHGPWERFLPCNNRVLTAGDTQFYLFPRLLRGVLRRELLALPTASNLRMAISHWNDKGMAKTLRYLAKRGIGIEILAHDTERRVPRWIENLLDENLLFRRYRHPEGVPMHNKFILIDTPRYREVIFGSMNLSKGSLHANHELLAISASPFLYDAFQDRWEQMVHEAEAMTP
jgi:hypothetical protein